MDIELGDKILDLVENYEIDFVEEGEWIQEHRLQWRNSIVEYEGKYYRVTQYRTGSTFTDWHYEQPLICEVERHEIVTTIVSWETKR